MSRYFFAALIFFVMPVFEGGPAVMAQARGVLNIAHRGARSLAPENTIPSFKIGISRCKADMIELDVHLSKDGVPVVIHDETLERTTDARQRFPDRAPWRVFDFTAAELTSLDAGSWFVQTDPFGQIKAGEVPKEDLARFSNGHVRIPTLHAVLEVAKVLNCRVNVEIKNFPSYYPGLAEKTVAEIQSSGMIDRVIVSSFDHETLFQLKKMAPEIQLGALLGQPVFPLKEYVVDLLGAKAVNPGLDVLGFESLAYHQDGSFRVDLIDQAKKAGLSVNVWTVNEPEIMNKLIDAGVSRIFTDFPQRLQTVLSKRSGFSR